VAVSGGDVDRDISNISLYFIPIFQLYVKYPYFFGGCEWWGCGYIGIFDSEN